MRVLGDTLTAAQLAMGDAKVRLALTKTGSTSYTYYIDAGDDRIMALTHTEQEWSQTATVVVQDSSATISALDLRGYQGVISYGYGANYSACAPLWVVAQKTDSTGGSIRTTLELKGIFDFLDDDKASVAWSASDQYVSPVQKIIEYVLAPDPGYPMFSHCTNYTLTVDSRDTGAGAVDTYAPKDYFFIAAGESRLSVIKRLVGWVGIKLRVEADGAVHLFVPEGTTAQYAYNDVVTGHNFFSKAVRKRIVIPNYVTVSSHPDHADSYTGYKADTTNDGDIELRSPPHYIRAVSNAQCTAIATAILKHHQLEAERGSGFVPMNCGQEVFDYVSITDSWVGDDRSGNVGYIVRQYSPGEFTMRFGFGSLALSGVGAIPFIDAADDYAVSINALIEAYDGLRLDLHSLLFAYRDIVNYLMARREVVPKWHIEKQAIMPVWIPGAPTVSTEAVSSIAATTATGNGTIEDMGVPDPTQHGVCYNTTGSPTIASDKTTEGVPTGDGAFTSSMTSLVAETLYYLRAYATNTTGTGYGIQVTFTTLEAA